MLLFHPVALSSRRLLQATGNDSSTTTSHKQPKVLSARGLRFVGLKLSQTNVTPLDGIVSRCRHRKIV